MKKFPAKNIITLVITLAIAILLYFIDSTFDGNLFKVISENVIVKIITIFLTLGGLVSLFLPFTFKKDLSETDISKISRKTYHVTKEEDEQNQRLKDQATF